MDLLLCLSKILDYFVLIHKNFGLIYMSSLLSSNMKIFLKSSVATKDLHCLTKAKSIHTDKRTKRSIPFKYFIAPLVALHADLVEPTINSKNDHISMLLLIRTCIVYAILFFKKNHTHIADPSPRINQPLLQELPTKYHSRRRSARASTNGHSHCSPSSICYPSELQGDHQVSLAWL